MPLPPLSSLFTEMPRLDHSPADSDSSLSEFESLIVSIAHTRWPTSSLEIAEFLGHAIHTREEKRILSSRIAYHVKKLVEKKKLVSKRVGNALIVWPYEVEHLRVIHNQKHITVKPVVPRGVN